MRTGSTILVTGVTGQVARPLAAALAREHTVYGAARFRDSGIRDVLTAAGVRCVPVNLVTAGRDGLAALPEQVDHVLHFGVVKSNRWGVDLDGNVGGTLALMERYAAARSFLHCSSGAVYADAGDAQSARSAGGNGPAGAGGGGPAEAGARAGDGGPAEAGGCGPAGAVRPLAEGDRVVAAGTHLVVGDRGHRHVVAVEADRRDVPFVDVDEVLVHPAVGLRAVVVERLPVVAAADVLHAPDAAPLDAGAGVTQPGGQPALPQVGRLHDVIVDADDPRQLTERVGGLTERVGGLVEGASGTFTRAVRRGRCLVRVRLVRVGHGGSLRLARRGTQSR
nr:NAD-dependent epimerase/dehydratase family protein [Parafrankia sp. CH37]